MRQRNPKEEWLESSAYQSINKIVNTVCLEQFSEDDSGATITNHEPSPKRIRMERHIRLLREKNEQQETVILSARAQTRLNNIENAFESVEFPAQISTPRSSTSALIRSNEITPQERKRRIKMKGESPSRDSQTLITRIFTKSLAIWLQKAICRTRTLGTLSCRTATRRRRLRLQ